MDMSERFLRFAAECEMMAKSSRSAESRSTWKGLAARWTRCAELAAQNDPVARRNRKLGRDFAPGSY